MATREHAKSQRRQAIVAAARELIQASGTTGFSMRALAERAGVSIATPYNLFGSKQAIMLAILETEMQEYRHQLQRARKDAVEALFKAVTVATSRYASAPGFHRALLFSVYNDGGTEFRSMFSGTSHALWRELVAATIESGHLSPDIEPNAFAINLEHLFFAGIMEWVNNQLSIEELELRVQYGFALSMLAMAEPATATRLRARALDLQTGLWRLWKQAGVQPAPGPSDSGLAVEDAPPRPAGGTRRTARAIVR